MTNGATDADLMHAHLAWQRFTGDTVLPPVAGGAG